MKDRVILHSDINSCYASIELLHRPEMRGKPLAVGGDPEARHGIVLAKDEIAKKAGVKTGMALWQAKQVCPNIQFVPPRMDLYLRFSRMAHEIYADYTDQQEPYGIDECWLDVTRSAALFGDGYTIAKEINRRMKEELGITVSIGVSWNKIFAKLGSDYKKPDAITVISKENYQDIVWPLPASDLLYVGPSTTKKLESMCVHTIGQLAAESEDYLRYKFGKMGCILHSFANGLDSSPVALEDASAPIKSIGNSTTTPRDLTTDQDVWIILFVLAESVAARLRENGFRCRVVEISVRDKDLGHYSRQVKLESSTAIAKEIAETGFGLFKKSYRWEKPIRSLGIRGSDLIPDWMPEQMNLFVDTQKREKLDKIEQSVDGIRTRFGFASVQHAVMYCDRKLSKLNAKEDHTVHPHGYF